MVTPSGYSGDIDGLCGICTISAGVSLCPLARPWAVASATWTETTAPVTNRSLLSDIPLGPSETRQTGPRPLEPFPRTFLLGRLAVSSQASLSTWLNTLKQFQQDVCPSDPRAGRRLCASSASARSHVVLTTWQLLCILLTYVCICKCVCVLCLVAQSCLTLQPLVL